jgi:hypothetical protein
MHRRLHVVWSGQVDWKTNNGRSNCLK